MTITTKKSSDQYAAIILAAGQGRRLRPLTNNLPKCLIEVCGRPILNWQLSALEQNKIKNITIVVGFRNDLIRKYALRNFPGLNLKFVHNPKHATTNTLYSLALAAETDFGNYNILQLNGDVVFNPKIIAMLLKNGREQSCIAANYKKCGKEEIKILLNDNGAIAALNKKVSPKKTVGEAIGINKFSAAFWKSMSKNLLSLKNNFPNEYFEYAVEKTIAEGGKLIPHNISRLDGIEIDFEKDLRLARKVFTSLV